MRTNNLEKDNLFALNGLEKGSSAELRPENYFWGSDIVSRAHTNSAGEGRTMTECSKGVGRPFSLGGGTIDSPISGERRGYGGLKLLRRGGIRLRAIKGDVVTHMKQTGILCQLRVKQGN